MFIFLCYILQDEVVPLLTALFFLIHPIQTEAVSYIAGINDPLYVSFMMLALLVFFIHKNIKQAMFCILFFCLALLSKELAVVAIGIIFIHEVLFHRSFATKKYVLFAIIAGIGTLYIIARLTVLQFSDISLYWRESVYGTSLFVRLATFFRIFFITLGLFIFPRELHLERDFTTPILTNILNPWTLFFVLLNAGIIIGVIKFMSTDIQRRNTALFLWFSFLISLLPFSGVILLNGIFYEHYLYQALIWFFAFVLYCVKPLLKHKISILIITIVVILFVIRSYIRQYEWIDNIRLYKHTLTFAPKSIRVLNNLGFELANVGALDEAIGIYGKAIKIDDTKPQIYHNLANIFVTKKQYEKAESYFLKAIQIDPNFYYSYYALLNMYMQTNNNKKAIALLEKEMLPRYPNDDALRQIYNKLGDK